VCVLGCVDFTNPDHAGLGIPIEALSPIVANYRPKGLSRTDIWMMAAIVAADLLQPQSNPLDFPISWIGRKTCRALTKNNCGKNFLGDTTTCEFNSGPHRDMCHGDSGTDTLLEFFRREFGFNAQQVTAIMGAHSLGTMTRSTSGFDAAAGWDQTNAQLDNGYFLELVGNVEDPLESSVPDWTQVRVKNTDLGKPDRLQWNARVGQLPLAMLNVDVALVREIRDGPNGAGCFFKNKQSRCPDATETIGHVIRYSRDNQVFLEDFRDVLYALVEHGYVRTGHCFGSGICRLEKRA
jgi:hypothetical protein